MIKVIKVILSFLFVIFAPLSIVFGKEVIVGGDNIGIELDFEGILISGTYDVKYNNTIYNPSRNDIKKGDYMYVYRFLHHLYILFFMVLFLIYF